MVIEEKFIEKLIYKEMRHPCPPDSVMDSRIKCVGYNKTVDYDDYFDYRIFPSVGSFSFAGSAAAFDNFSDKFLQTCLY